MSVGAFERSVRLVYTCDTIALEAAIRDLHPDSLEDRDGGTLLGHAVVAEQPSFEIIALLLRRGADPDRRRNDGCTPLHFAVQRGSIDIVQLLLDFGAAPNVADIYGNSALHKAVFQKPPRRDLVKLLIDAGANPNLPNHRGTTPKQVADLIGYADLFADS